MWDSIVDLARKELFMIAYAILVIAVWWAGEQVFYKITRR
jgi:hypothetical protein